ncbi:hypothetical protein BJ742DRAFT_827415 [Cladochytrium replicatum]|nr:hypothetical protein BJ742DRAFT_827415 [Cladochytrium replicatum]
MTTETAAAEPGPVVDATVEATPTEVVAKAKKERKPRKPRAPKEPKPAGEDGAPAEPEEEDNTHKVFVGNLAFTTTSEELTTFCTPAGPVVKVEIITRGTRSLGYGFVSYNNEEEAQKAVSLFDKQELGGRQINVELAKLREAGEGKAKGSRVVRSVRKGRSYLGRGGRRRVKKAGAEGDGAEKRVDDEEPTEGEGATDKSGGEEAGEKSTRGRGGRGRGRSAGRRRFPRAAREPKEGEEPAPLSETMLFVANLPFKVTDEDLKSIFKDYKVTTAKVVRLKSGKSKGFGFVEVESHEEQQRVLTELKNVVVDSRELVVKVALANAAQIAENEENEAEAAPAAEETKA